jgi:hypothetical protein
MARPKKNPEAAPKAPAPLRVFMVSVGGEIAYVRAATKNQAIRHVTAKKVAAHLMPDELIEALKLQDQVQYAGPPTENPSF